eukprot:COSAG03_NODE_21513_length_303_cov_0.759804_1_plen_68_part_10
MMVLDMPQPRRPPPIHRSREVAVPAAGRDPFHGADTVATTTGTAAREHWGARPAGNREPERKSLLGGS